MDADAHSVVLSFFIGPFSFVMGHLAFLVCNFSIVSFCTCYYFSFGVSFCLFGRFILFLLVVVHH